MQDIILITYIIVTKKLEYYCGKTKNIIERLNTHKKENKPHWFKFNNRNEWEKVYIINGDYEKKIKSFGVKQITLLIENYNGCHESYNGEIDSLLKGGG